MPRFTPIEMQPVDPNQITSRKKYFFLLAVPLLCLLCLSHARGGIREDSLMAALYSTNEPSERARIMMNLAKEYYYTDMQEAIRYARQAHDLYSKLEDDEGITSCVNILGAGYFSLGEYAMAESFFKDALRRAKETGDSLMTGKILNNLAGIKLNTGDLTQAVDYYARAGTIFRKLYDTEGAIGIEISIASIYRSVGSYRKAHEHLDNAIALTDQETDLHLQGTLYQNLGALLLDEEKYDEALHASLHAYELRRKAGHLNGQIKILINLGSVFYATGKNEYADTCYRKARQLAADFGYKEDEAWVLMHLGYLRYEAQDYPNASVCFTQSLSLADELRDKELILQLHNYLFLTDSARGDFRTALTHLQEYNQVKSDYPTHEAAQKLEELEALYTLAKSENQQKEHIIQKNKSLIACLIAGLIILVLITILFVQQILLRSQKRIADLTQENLRSQMNPHFIFNILNSIHSFLLKNDTQASGNYLVKFSNLLRLTLDNSRSKIAPIQDELDALRLYLELETMRFGNRLDYEIIVDEEIDPIMFKIPTFLLQPYVENSIVHGLQHKEGKGKIEIRLDYRQKGIHCSITDNGVGREKAEDIKREKGIKRKSHGSEITETRLKLLNTIYGRKYSVLYTDLLDENRKSSGTKVEFDLPVLN